MIGVRKWGSWGGGGGLLWARPDLGRCALGNAETIVPGIVSVAHKGAAATRV